MHLMWRERANHNHILMEAHQDWWRGVAWVSRVDRRWRLELRDADANRGWNLHGEYDSIDEAKAVAVALVRLEL